MSANTDQDQRHRALLEAPAYPTAEAARLVGLSAGQVKRWLRGYDFDYRTKEQPQLRHSKKPPVVPRVKRKRSTYASFLDIIDLLLVQKFLEEDISLQQVRVEFEEAKSVLGVDHLGYETFFTLGRKVFLEIDSSWILALSSGGQMAIDQLIRDLGHQIEFDEQTKLAIRWYPLHPDRRVVIDPFVSFGRPVISGRRVTTSNIYDFFIAENERVDVVCEWMGVEKAEVQSAVELETKLAA
ncbi:MAG TPA: DUF433 domain-containing protein [Anaerolineales bacterium]|jgi:uncharacterized protein (DUF433 family)